MTTKKSLGQHWLNDSNILEEIVQTSQAKSDDNVLEIGPGQGSLTAQLLKTGVQVIAVEKDKALAEDLKNKFKNQKFSLAVEDILEFDLAKLPKNYKVVANIPYYLTSNLIRVLSESSNPPASMTLLVQKEVAERICARPGQMSILGVAAQFYFVCSLGIIVEPEKFTPPPKVDSQVVHMVRKSTSSYKNVDMKLLFRVVKAGFSNRRKTLENSLSSVLHKSKADIATLLQSCGIEPKTRAQELSIAQWIELSKMLS